jgi:hypothetical protein
LTRWWHCGASEWTSRDIREMMPLLLAESRSLDPSFLPNTYTLEDRVAKLQWPTRVSSALSAGLTLLALLLAAVGL